MTKNEKMIESETDLFWPTERTRETFITWNGTNFALKPNASN